jgi:hypothetical protein
LDRVGLSPCADYRGENHTLARARQHLKIRASLPPKDAIVAIGADSKVIEITLVLITTENTKMTVSGARGQVSVHFHSYIIELNPGIGPGQPIALIQLDEILSPSITAIILLALIGSPSTLILKIISKIGHSATTNAASADQQ